MKMFKTFGLLAVLACGSTLGAAEYSHYLRVNVPFAFVVAGQQFAPGAYDVRETSNGIITVQGVGKAAAVISTPLETAKEGEASSLRFTNTGDGEYLAGVSVEGEGSRAVPVPVHERRLAIASR